MPFGRPRCGLSAASHERGQLVLAPFPSRLSSPVSTEKSVLVAAVDVAAECDRHAGQGRTARAAFITGGLRLDGRGD